MNSKQNLVAIYALLLAAASAAYAGPSSRLAYAQKCAAQMGTIPSFNCMNGAIIPITKNGVAQTQPTASCDKPIQLGTSGGACVPFARFQRLNTGNPDVETLVICRKYHASSGPNDKMFHDIAMIQHHKGTGETCFFQSPVDEEPLDGSKVPSPQESSAAASKYWLEPIGGGPQGITCSHCHDSDPFIWSPYIVQVADISKWNPFGPWNSNSQDLFGTTVKTFKPAGNACVSCHRIGSNTCNPGGAISTHEYADQLLMPVGFSGNGPEWHSDYDPAMAQLDQCCNNPSQPGCGTEVAQGKPAPADRYAAIWTKASGGAWVARHDMNGDEYQKEFNKYNGKGMRLVMVDGYELNGSARYAALWEKKPTPAWVARHGMMGDQYQQEFNKNSGQGLRLVWINGYTVGGSPRYAAIWEKSAGPAAVARHGLTSAQYQQEFNKWSQQGYRLKLVSGYASGSEARYAAIWEKASGPAQVARHGLTSSQYQQEFNKWTGQGFRLSHVSGYRVGSSTLYAAIWEKSAGAALAARHGMTGSDYQAAFNQLAQQGYRLQEVSGY
jgi:Bacterial tandem repeat domain 1